MSILPSVRSWICFEGAPSFVLYRQYIAKMAEEGYDG